jgi:branched-chain amino acid transport system permease protein
MPKSSFLRDLVIGIVVVMAAALLDRALGNPMVHDLVLRLCSLGLFAISLNLLVGYTGLLSFGQATFYGAGAYAFTLLMQKSGLSIPSAFVLTLLGVSLFSVVVGALCVRLSGVYFTFLTLAIQMMFYSMLIAWSSFTGGEQGLTGGLPKPQFIGIDLTNKAHFYIFNLSVFVLSLVILRRIVASPFGVALRMIRDNPERALFLGVPVQRYKLVAFVTSSLFATAAGVLASLFVSGAFPNFAYWTTSGEGLFIIMLGGVTNFFGPVVGALLLIVLEGEVNARFTHHGLALGLVILFAVLGMRKGVLDFLSDMFSSNRKRAADRKAQP